MSHAATTSSHDGRASNPLVGLRFYIDSLGCAKNLVDSEATLGILLSAGLERSATPEQAELLLVNTCGFLEAAREESVQRILELAQLKAYGRARLLAVLGCLVSRAPEELAEAIPEVDVWLPAGAHAELDVRLRHILAARPASPLQLATDRSGSGRAPLGAFAGFGARVLMTPSHTAYLKISEGCSNTCSFCSIPLMRGTQRSRSIESLVRESEGLAACGVRELHLVAQDLTHYGFDLPGRPDLLDLVRALAGVDGIEWLRLLYAHPSHFTPRMLQHLFETPKVVPYLDIPVQHASARILRAMRRPYTPARVRAQLHALRSRQPEITLRTTVIVGFPGETEVEFGKLLRFVEEMRFDRLGVFAYSREPGTPAFDLRGRPRRHTVARRMHELVELQLHLAGQRSAQRVGTRTRVLVDCRLDAAAMAAEAGGACARGAVAVGRSAAEALDIDGAIYLDGDVGVLEPGTFVDVEITRADVYDLRGRLLRAPSNA
ncbi:MAG: 30S ribosomal protein S12 methylthiotransferase RimO [Candidatus Latescibacterota bacterium]|nr:MAG: 30S ribosomal protein S12 methylthiotransferase RimO [Candidatus Latescibacterota bacterium]